MEQDQKKMDALQLHHFLGKKWAIGILYILEKDTTSYNQLFNILRHRISPTLLSLRLKELIHFGFIQQNTDHQKITYTITKNGNEFLRFLHQLENWARKNGYSFETAEVQGRAKNELK
jgi:DNA-binding HxlR family transcriptional regulator